MQAAAAQIPGPRVTVRFSFLGKLPDVGDERLDHVRGGFAAKSRHLASALGDDGVELGIRLLLHYVRAQIFGLEGFAGGSVGAAVFTVAERAIGLEVFGGVILRAQTAWESLKAPGEENDCERRVRTMSLHVISLFRSASFRRNSLG